MNSRSVTSFAQTPALYLLCRDTIVQVEIIRRKRRDECLVIQSLAVAQGTVWHSYLMLAKNYQNST